MKNQIKSIITVWIRRYNQFDRIDVHHYHKYKIKIYLITQNPILHYCTASFSHVWEKLSPDCQKYQRHLEPIGSYLNKYSTRNVEEIPTWALSRWISYILDHLSYHSKILHYCSLETLTFLVCWIFYLFSFFPTRFSSPFIKLYLPSMITSTSYCHALPNIISHASILTTWQISLST